MAGYLQPLGIVAMLEFPIGHDGELYGMVSFEQPGAPRRWSHEEQMFGRLLANILGVLLRRAGNESANTALKPHAISARETMIGPPA